MNSEKYSHTQVGWVILGAVGAALLLILYILTVLEFNWIPLVVMVILGVTMVLFSTLRVVADRNFLEIRFGLGLIRKKFSLRDIVSSREVKNPWYYGWGIRLTPHGWLFNVSGLHAVEIQIRNGKRYRIGTDDPQGLAEFLRKQISTTRDRVEG